MSSVRNFCVRSSGVISIETVDVVVKCRLFSQAALAENCLRGIEIRTCKVCTRCLACTGSSNRRGQEKGEETLEEVSKLSSLASTPWSVRCLSSLVTVRKINKTISRPFAEL